MDTSSTLGVTNGRIEDYVPDFGTQSSSQALLDLLPAAVYICALDGTIVRFNRRAAELWGREPLLGDPRDRFCGSYRMYRLDGGSLPHDECPMADILRNGTPVRDQEVVIERTDGSRCIALVNIRPLKDAAGNITGAVNCFHDITERKQAEQEYVLTRNQVEELTLKLAQERDQSRALIDAQPAAIYTADAAGRITFYNNAAAELWGFRPELGKTELWRLWKLYHSDGREMQPSEYPIAVALELKRPIRGMEAVAKRPDGTRVPFLAYPTPLFDASGALVGAVNMLVDISERRRAEKEQAALHQLTDRLYRADRREAVYDAALDAISGALGCERTSILLVDESGVMRFVAWRGLSDAYRRGLDGHSPWMRNAKDPQPICIEDVDSADLPDSLKATVKAEGITACAFIPLMAKGELIGKFMAYYRVPHAFTQGEIDLAVTVARQLGFGIERICSDEERRSAEQAGRLLVSIIENSDDAIVSKDLNGIVTSWNQGAERVFGYTAEEMVGRPIVTLIPPDRHNEEADILNRIRRGERIDHFETVRRRKDGTLIDVSLTVSPVRDGTGKIAGASKIVRDITERKEAQARHDMLTREIQHRTKNLFAVVQAVVSRSFAGKKTVGEAESAVLSRLSSLAQTHVLLMDQQWRGAELVEIVNAEMQPYADRVLAHGPSFVLSAKAAQNFALAIHELATNAAKYGALSATAGRVFISWSLAKKNGSTQFTFRWQERGGPAVSPPAKKGFGSAVLEQVMAEYFDVPPIIEFASGGVCYELSGLLESVSEQQAAETTIE
jgi:PAS domain S-box-containing protein